MAPVNAYLEAPCGPRQGLAQRNCLASYHVDLLLCKFLLPWEIPLCIFLAYCVFPQDFVCLSAGLMPLVTTNFHNSIIHRYFNLLYNPDRKGMVSDPKFLGIPVCSKGLPTLVFAFGIVLATSMSYLMGAEVCIVHTWYAQWVREWQFLPKCFSLAFFQPWLCQSLNLAASPKYETWENVCWGHIQL